MTLIPDDPIIERMERTGYPRKSRGPVCPVCGEECSIVYEDANMEIVGCDECLTPVDATDEAKCF